MFSFGLASWYFERKNMKPFFNSGIESLKRTTQAVRRGASTKHFRSFHLVKFNAEKLLDLARLLIPYVWKSTNYFKLL